MVCKICATPRCSSTNPIRYSDGLINLVEHDLKIVDGYMFGQRRSFANEEGLLYDGPNGYNWYVSSIPQAMADGNSVLIVFDANESFQFDLVPASSPPTYTSAYPSLDVLLVQDVAAQTFTFIQQMGGTVQKTVLNDFSATNPGGFVSFTDSRGVTTTVAARTGSRIDELQRQYSSGGITTTESLVYSYFGSGGSVDKIQYVTFRKKVGSGAWVSLQRAAYTYYGSTDAQGSQNDLKLAARQMPNGSGGWDDVAACYYRYYKSGASLGFAHALKMHFGAESFRRMFNDGINIDTASDATVLPYVDHYFEYDSATSAVTKEISAVCSSCVGGGTTADFYNYVKNPRFPREGYNVWDMKTTQTLPDGSQIIVYTNAFGMPMLNVHVNATGTSKWCEFSRYDDDGYLIWSAHPSCVAGYDDSYDDLLNYVPSTGLYQYLSNSDGLIDVSAYYSATNIGLGQVKGYLSSRMVRKGQSGSDILLASFTYTSNTANGVTIYPTATQVTYPDASNPATTITTSYSYSWYSGTNQIQQKTTTLPLVPTAQNGPNTTAAITENYDVYGNMTQRTDERGFVNQYVYDLAFGRVLQQTLNYQSGVTAPGVNIVTDFTYDDQGRLVQTLGPSHTVVLGGSATVVRPATWNVYIESAKPSSGIWGPNENRSGQGYATGSAPSYTYTLVDPVSLSRTDKDGRSLDQISSKRTTGSGKLSASDTFAQTDWKSWSSTQYNDKHQTVSSRVYHLIPSSGTGTVTTNYGQTDYGYDVLERRNRVVSPGGTISRTVWTAPQRVASTWVGTNDTGATDSNPAGSGSPNNMVQITANVYDGGGIGDGNLTQVTQYVSSTSGDTRVTSYGYDFRNRQVSVDGEIDVYAQTTYDNLDRAVQVDRRNTTSTGTLIGRSTTSYDNRGRVYEQLTYAVNPSTGAVGNALKSSTWYDLSGNILQQIQSGNANVFTKQSYNGVGWVTASYQGYNTSGTSYSQANTVANDTIISQSVNTYNEVGSVLSTASYARLNDATGTGALSYGTQPKARVSYAGMWYDGIDRPIASANYGAISSFTRPTTPPSSSSTVLVSSVTYDNAGRTYQTIDSKGVIAQNAYDDAGRTTQVVEDVGGLNRTTNTTYTLDNQVATLVAVNAATGNQTTAYTYGTTLSDSDVATSMLLRYTDYPGSVSGSDRTANTYNRLGQLKTFTDQRGTVHTNEFDKLGRPIHDRVTTVGSGTSSWARRISTSYDVRGMVRTITTYDSATIGSGTVLNQVQMNYNNFGQLIEELQGVDDIVGTIGVRYGYADGSSSSNQIRPTTLTYPNNRVITSYYGSSGSMNDRLSRVEMLQDTTSGTTDLAGYTYMGTGAVIRITYPQPSVWLDLWGGTSGTFNGFDQFGRVTDQLWQNNITSTPVTIDRYQYGYDLDSNRQWKRNVTATGLDEYYTYDNLNRLTVMKRGTLTGTPPTGISGTPANEQDFALDATGNWSTYLTKTSGTTDLNQTRASSTVNEITGFTTSTGTAWATPAYDPAGNMTTMPKPANPSSAFTTTYDAWNRLVNVSDTGGTVATYKYDGRGRRIVKTTTATGETRRFYYTSAWQNIEERVGTSSSMDRQHVWGIRYVDELICRDDSSSNRVYACQDANFNVTTLASSSGTVLQHFGYDPYGNSTVYNASWATTTDAYGWLCRFQGGFVDPVTLLYYFRNRDLHPQLGTWTRRDPIGYADSLNLYQYVGSNPVIGLDPSGSKTVDLRNLDMTSVGTLLRHGLMLASPRIVNNGGPYINDESCGCKISQNDRDKAGNYILSISASANKDNIAASVLGKFEPKENYNTAPITSPRRLQQFEETNTLLVKDAWKTPEAFSKFSEKNGIEKLDARLSFFGSDLLEGITTLSLDAQLSGKFIKAADALVQIKTENIKTQTESGWGCHITGKYWIGGNIGSLPSVHTTDLTMKVPCHCLGLGIIASLAAGDVYSAFAGGTITSALMAGAKAVSGGK